MHRFSAQGFKSINIFHVILISSLAPSLIAFLNTPVKNYGKIIEE